VQAAVVQQIWSASVLSHCTSGLPHQEKPGSQNYSGKCDMFIRSPIIAAPGDGTPIFKRSLIPLPAFNLMLI
jgi:hypothetical protein